MTKKIGFPTQSSFPDQYTGVTLFDLVAASINWSIHNTAQQLTVDGGSTASAIIATSEVAIEALSAGMEFGIFGQLPNPGAMTANINSIGVVAIVDAQGDALTGGEFQTGLFIRLRYDGTALRIVSQAPASGSGLIDVQEFAGDGTWTKPDGNYRTVRILIVGGGGSGAYQAAVGIAHHAQGGGGGAAVVGTIPFPVLGSTEAIVIGAGGGTTGPNDVGEAGGDSSFGSWVTAGGGAGGLRGTLTAVVPAVLGGVPTWNAAFRPISPEVGGDSGAFLGAISIGLGMKSPRGGLNAGPGGETLSFDDVAGVLSRTGNARSGLGGVSGSEKLAVNASGYGAGGSAVRSGSATQAGTGGYCLVVSE